MITVELTPGEIYLILVKLREILKDAFHRGDTAAQMKYLLARIEYLEGLK